MNWIKQLVHDQWHTWIQHFGLLALTVGIDLRLGFNPALTALVAVIMIVREAAHIVKHDREGGNHRIWAADLVMDWITVVAGIGFGFWVYG